MLLSSSVILAARIAVASFRGAVQPAYAVLPRGLIIAYSLEEQREKRNMRSERIRRGG